MRWHAPFIVIVGLAAASAALLPASVGSQPADPCAVPAATTTGAIRGMLHDDSQTCSWHGIPFAAPPRRRPPLAGPHPARTLGGHP